MKTINLNHPDNIYDARKKFKIIQDFFQKEKFSWNYKENNFADIYSKEYIQYQYLYLDYL